MSGRESMQVRWSAFMYAGLLLLATLAVYWGHLDGPLVFDDVAMFTGNYASSCGAQFSPLTLRWWPCWSFAMQRVLFDADVPALRLGNLAVHVLCVWALFFFLRRLFREWLPEAEFPARRAAQIAFVAALWFALHPANVYAVAYLAQRSILLATMFSLLCLTLFLDGLLAQRRWSLFGAVVCYGFAVFSKEHATVLVGPLVCLMLLFRRRWGWSFDLVGTLLACIAIALLITMRRHAIVGVAYEEWATLSYATAQAVDDAYIRSVLTQSAAFFRYLATWLWPDPGSMAIDVRSEFAPEVAVWPYVTAVAGLLLMAIVGVWLIWQGGWLALAGLASVMTLAMFAAEFSTVRLQEIFVIYRGYLWMPFALVALPLAFRPLSRSLVVAIALVLAGGLFWAARDRLETFSSEIAVWEDAVRLAERQQASNFIERLYYNRGLAYAKARRFADAERDYDKVLEVSPRHVLALLARADLKARLRRDAEAIEDYSATLPLYPDFIPALVGRGSARIRLGLQAEGLADLQRACDLKDYMACYLLKRQQLGTEVDVVVEVR